MGNFFSELKRRHIYRVAAAYAVVAWVLLQLFNNVSPILEAPPWVGRTILLLLVLGFPVALVLAWVLELKAADATARPATGRLDWVLIGALAVVIGIFAYQQIDSNSSPRTLQQANASAAPGTNSIAVLPFGNLSGDASQEFFSDGMTEEITAALAKVPDLQVVARASAFQFKGQQKDMRAVGQALGARYLIDGSVRKAGNRVRITAQLIRADSGVNVWSNSYDRELTDVFATQEDIAQAIAGALKVPLGLAKGETLVHDRTKDIESYDQYLRAKALVRARAEIPEDVIVSLEELVAKEPGYAPAWALLSRVRYAPDILIRTRSDSIEEARRLVQSQREKMEMAARKAIELDSRQASAYVTLATVQYMVGKWMEAEDTFKQALALDPNDPDALYGYSGLLRNVGRSKEAVTVRDRVLKLEPLSPLYKGGYAVALQVTGQTDKAIAVLEDTPPGFLRNAYLAQAYATAGRYNDGANTLSAIAPQDLSVTRRSLEDAARLLRMAPAKVGAPESLPVLEGELGFVYAYVGAPERVLDYPERNLQIGNAGDNLARTLWHPDYAPVRKTERFKAYVRKAGLVEYWKARGWPDLCRPMGADDFVCD